MGNYTGMQIFLLLALLFMSGSFIGYVIEVFFRRFVSAKRWINPGFLNGPCLPLYGFSLLFLYICSYYLSRLTFFNWPNWARDVCIILMFGVGMTLIEYLAGLIFIKGLNVRLWDYTNMRGNIQGLICPLFSLIWLAMGGLYYFFLHPLFVSYASFYFAHEAYLDWFLGLTYGVLVYDLIVSFNLVARLSAAAHKNKIIVSYMQFKVSRAEEKKKREAAFLSENPGVEMFLTEQKARQKELIGRLLYKDEGHKLFQPSLRRVSLRQEIAALKAKNKPNVTNETPVKKE